MNKPLKILLVEDSPDDVYLIERELTKAGLIFTWVIVSKKAEFEKALKEFYPDVILADHSLPHFNSIEALELYKAYQNKLHLYVPFILITGAVSEEFAAQCINAGMDDYILKDQLKRLPSSIERALEKCRIESDRIRFLSR